MFWNITMESAQSFMFALRGFEVVMNPTNSIDRKDGWMKVVQKQGHAKKNCAVVGKSPSTKTQTNHNLYVVQSTVERSSI